MDFLKNLLVSGPGCGGTPVQHPLPPAPEWVNRGRARIPSAVTWQGAPGRPLMGHGSCLSLGGRGQTLGTERTVCIQRVKEAMASGHVLGLPSLAWRAEVGVLALDWAELTSVFF